jgi:hypothetical protein
VRGLAAGLTAFALVAPATAAAGPSLIAQARTNMQRETAFDEAHHILSFKRGTKFMIACSVRGQNVLCTEHTGSERCVGGRPWLLLSDIFPIIHGRVGQSLAFGLTITSNYCRAA